MPPLVSRMLCLVEMVESLYVHELTSSTDTFHTMILQEYWVMTESRVLLESVLVAMMIFVIFIQSHKQTR